MSAKTSFGSEPPRFGRIAGFLPVVRSIEAAAHLTQGDSGSRRVAWKIASAQLRPAADLRPGVRGQRDRALARHRPVGQRLAEGFGDAFGRVDEEHALRL